MPTCLQYLKYCRHVGMHIFWAGVVACGRSRRNTLVSIYLFPGGMINYNDRQHGAEKYFCFSDIRSKEM